MKRRSKKVICILLGILLTVNLLSACSKKQTEEPTDQSGTNEATKAVETNEGTEKDQAQKESGGDKVTVRFGYTPADTASDTELAKWQGELARFNEKYPDVELIDAHYDYATETFVPLAESGNLPTVFGTWFSEPQKIINAGYAADITDILEERGWLDSMNPSIRNILSDSEGRVYGIPKEAYALGIMINVELFEQAGLVDADGYPVYPTTWAELAKTAKKIKDATGEAGFCLLAQDNAGGWHFTNIAWAFGAELTIENADGTFTANVNTPEAIAAMEYVRSLKWEYDVLTADPTAENWGTGFDHIGAGTAAMYIAANDTVRQPVDKGLDASKVAMCAMPAGPDGLQYSLSGGTPYMFSKDAAKEEINAAIDMLEIMGNGPELISLEGFEEQTKADAANNYPTIKPFAIWTNEDLIKEQEAIIDKYGIVDPKMYENYFDITKKAGNLHQEESGATQELYEQLNKVIQEVIVNENADIEALMKTANDNYQTILDELK